MLDRAFPFSMLVRKLKGGDFWNKPSIVWHCGFIFCARFMKFFVVGIEAKAEVHAKNWTSRMILTFLFIFLQKKKKCHSLPFSKGSTGQQISMMAQFMLASIRNIVLCHMATKSLQVRPDNNQGINTALLATSVVRTMWEERGWFSPLTFQRQGNFKLWLKTILVDANQ